MDFNPMKDAYSRALDVICMIDDPMTSNPDLLEEVDLFATIPQLVQDLNDRHAVAWDLLSADAASMIRLLHNYVELRDAQMIQAMKLVTLLIDMIEK